MPLPDNVPEPAAAWLDDLPRATLEAMLAAGREVLEWRRILAKSGDNLVGEVLKHQGEFHVLDHYPKGDVFDPESHSQWYYHAHDQQERPGEHGHFHTFLRGGGMPEGIAPAPLPDLPPETAPQDLVCHCRGLDGPQRLAARPVHDQPLGHRRDLVRRPRRRRDAGSLRGPDEPAVLAGEPLAERPACACSGRRSRSSCRSATRASAPGSAPIPRSTATRTAASR